MQIEQLKNIIEAALLAASQPMNVQQLGDLFNEEDEVDREQIAKALEALAEDCTGRGVELREVASGFRYQVRQDVHPWISRMWTEKPSRYSRALLETLSLIAYRQPITRPEIEQIRGVVVSSNIVKTLEEREWIRVVGYRDVPGKPALFGTTRAFLDYFNLKSLDELPPLSEIRDMEDPQLRLDNDDIPARVVKDLPIDPDEVAEEATDTESTEAQADTAGEGAHEDTDDVEFQVAGHEHPSEPGHVDNHVAGEPITEPAQPADADVATSEPDAATPVEPPTVTAAEAANPSDAEHGEGTQDTEEYRA
ncbi:SMC-Scp complex subunit ScpB [Dyella koreensis]|uniref:SMC-Scp complex subunit ScpB n=1 Tax=Dyella koreensis TaxID=311235 RepID=A0ABW8K961_9GAMM